MPFGCFNGLVPGDQAGEADHQRDPQNADQNLRPDAVGDFDDGEVRGKG